MSWMSWMPCAVLFVFLWIPYASEIYVCGGVVDYFASNLIYPDMPSNVHLVQLTSSDVRQLKEFEKLKRIFENDLNIYIYIIQCNKSESTYCYTSVIYWSDIPFDRSCLLPPPMQPVRTKITYNGSFDNNDILDFINRRVNSFRTNDGGISDLGTIISIATQNLYEVSENDICPRISAAEMNLTAFTNSFWLRQRPVVITGVGTTDNPIEALDPFLKHTVGVKFSPSEEFEGVDLLSNWEASNQSCGDRHCKRRKQYVPLEVLEKLQSPDRVVVRAAHGEISLAALLRHLREGFCDSSEAKDGTYTDTDSNSTMCADPSLRTIAGNNCIRRRVTAYLEYLSLQTRIPALQQLLSAQFRSWANDLSLPLLHGEPHLWLGDGHTLGRLHFDAFDNLLWQLDGSKTFELLDPQHNERLYEGHMREAEVEFATDIDDDDADDDGGDKGSAPRACPRLRSEKLSQSTSMVHSPVRLHVPSDLEEFPLASTLNTMRCTVHAGEVLFVPSFWWHEVLSSPGKPLRRRRGRGRDQRVNMAVNFWYTPLFDKEFPCSTCRKSFNSAYRDVMLRLFAVGVLKK